MAYDPAIFVHVSTPSGVHRVPAAVAKRGGLRPLPDPASGPRGDSPKPRVQIGAATPTPEPEASASADPEEKE